MSITLEEALKEVELEPGRTYVCGVNGRQVEVRVRTSLQSSMAPAKIEDEGKIDAWFEIPPRKGTYRHRAKPGKMPPPDLPDIPVEDDSL